MDTKFLIEMIGYLGSILVLVSMLMSSVVKLRIINMIGSVIFAVYALIIHSYPTALMNFSLVFINIYYLSKLRNTEKTYSLIELGIKDGYLTYLIKSYVDDIKKYFPSFSQEKELSDTAFLVCCDGNAAGILTGKKEGNNLEIELDYSTPFYRDCSVGSFLYARLKQYGIESLTFQGGASGHVDYMKKMGFIECGDGKYKKVIE